MRSLGARRRAQGIGALAMLAAAALSAGSARDLRAADMQWIWSPAQAQDKNIPPGSCYFRKSFSMGQVESGEVQITCDDAYELFINGRKAGEGSNWRTLTTHDITRQLTPGRNTVAIKATNNEKGSAGLAARIVVKDAGGTHVAFNSDTSWRTSLQEFPQWTKHFFADSQWLPARVIGPFGTTPPWLDEVHAAGGEPAGRFETRPEFRVEPVVLPADTGSLLAMTFNEFGDIIASREGGGLSLLRDTNADGIPDKSITYCDKLQNCQGLLALNGQVFAVGQGHDGLALYRLTDADGDRQAEQIDTLLKFTGQANEHGPHGLTLGPDGMLYVVLGNHTQVDKTPHLSSPLQNYYEGDLISPKYEDPGGEAAGVKAPGGTVVRTDVNGSFVELFVGGLRNCYDIAFNRAGELFTYESDMEWDLGLPWYRPTRVLHLVPGGEYGWRSGWSTWPEYFFDSLPALLRSGRGSPTGVATYNHFAFPHRYHDALFLGDWSRGRILALRLTPERGSYKAEVETFAVGKPLNVTDLEVGPDGALYFCTGGRGSEGGIFRIVWRGRIPPEVSNMGQGIQQALRQPQLNSAFARQKIAAVKQQLGATWDTQLAAVALGGSSTSLDRCRALDLMQLFGPFPNVEQLGRLAAERDPLVRAKVAYMMGIHPNEATRSRLVEMLQDPDPMVQRLACEALQRAGQRPVFTDLVPLLSSGNRHVAYAARRLLETLPRDQYRAAVLNTNNQRLFVQGALAMLTASPDRETCLAIIERANTIMNGFVADPEFIDMLRVVQVALERGDIKPEELPRFAQRIVAEFPTRNASMNRELVRLIAYLRADAAATPILEQLAGNLPPEDKLHLALYARFLGGQTTAQKLTLLQFYEMARTLPGGHSLAGYVDNVSRDFFAGFTDQERAMVLADGSKWPNAAYAVLAKLPEELSTQVIQQIIALDRQMAGVDGDSARRVGIAVIAVLGRCRQPQASAYLHEIYAKFPERRGYVAMALTQNPDGENWDLLVQSLPVLEGDFAQEVLITLARQDRQSQRSEDIRQVILRGLKLGDEGGQHAVSLLEKWTGQQLSEPGQPPTESLAAWQEWFSQTYPAAPPPALPVESSENKWTYNELLTFLDGAEGARGDPRLGAAVFAKAQCASCHRYGERGGGPGPDLTTVAQRFQKKEILEAILFPSQVISDQYASKTVITAGGRVITGMVAKQADGSLLVLQTSGQQVRIAAADVDTTTPSKTSAMPEGLLNSLTLEEIANLFAYLNQPPTTSITSRRVMAPTTRR